jgi:hypothetical protein
MSAMRIKKGWHYSIHLPCLLIKPKQLSYDVEFTDSCRYDIGTEDQADINKLFGIGYFPSHHNKSVRIGWNYNIDTDKIELWAYWYTDWDRNWAYLKSVDINTTHRFTISVLDTTHVIDLGDVVFYIDLKPDSIGYLLMPYFGGNQPAPHDMIINLKRNRK